VFLSSKPCRDTDDVATVTTRMMERVASGLFVIGRGRRRRRWRGGVTSRLLAPPTCSLRHAMPPSVRPSVCSAVELITRPCRDDDSSRRRLLRLSVLAPSATDTDTAPLTQSLGDVSGPSGAGRPETVAGTHFKAYSNRVLRTNCALRIKKCAPRISSGIYFLSTS